MDLRERATTMPEPRFDAEDTMSELLDDDAHAALTQERAPGEDASVSEAPSEDAYEETSLALFEGDTSTLYPEQRRLLHALLKHRYISADAHPDEWATLTTSRDLVRSRLHDLYLDLYVDETYGIAFKRQARSETGDALPTLLRDVAHTKEETIVLMLLRQRFFTQQQEGDSHVFVDRQTLLDEVAGMRPEAATHRAMDHKRALKAIESLVSAGVLLKTPDVDRFRISPIIEVLLPVDRLKVLLAWLEGQNAGDVSPAEPVDDPSDAAGTATGELDLSFDLDDQDGEGDR